MDIVVLWRKIRINSAFFNDLNTYFKRNFYSCITWSNLILVKKIRQGIWKRNVKRLEISSFSSRVVMVSSLQATGKHVFGRNVSSLKVYVQNWLGPSNNILHRFCLTGGPPLQVSIIAQVQWFVYQNQLESSGGIYHLYKHNRLSWLRDDFKSKQDIVSEH